MTRARKILLGGAGGVGRTTLLKRFVENRWAPSSLTIGVDFFSKELEIEGKIEKIAFWDFAGQKRWRFFQETLCNGADGAILAFDYQRYVSFDDLEEWVNLFRKTNPNLPILLVGTKADSDNRAVQKFTIMDFISRHNIFDFVEVSSLTGENVKIVFENLVRKILGLDMIPVPEIPYNPSIRPQWRQRIRPNSNYALKTFKVNDYITLQLDWNITNIYVNGIHFSQCKYLLLNIPVSKIKEYDEIKSIDEAESKLDHSLEANTVDEIGLTPEVEFWGHCSNLQAWVEHDYDTRLLHRNLSFPLLKKLTEAGDPKAKRVFKDEIALRIEENNRTVTQYLVEEGYLSYFTPEELDFLSVKNPFLKLLSKLYIIHSRD
ncbi:MAG: GTP-binding protein [Candidatus Lokiarchaeota archaeon]|nr:GTP-binding protein [Candidatus Lokiarchaeota archaeon]